MNQWNNYTDDFDNDTFGVIGSNGLLDPQAALRTNVESGYSAVSFPSVYNQTYGAPDPLGPQPGKSQTTPEVAPTQPAPAAAPARRGPTLDEISQLRQHYEDLADAGFTRVTRTDSGGFTMQVMQRAVLQWRPELGTAVPTNLFDDLDEAALLPLRRVAHRRERLMSDFIHSGWSIYVAAVTIVGLVARVSMPFRLPASLFAIVVGTVLGVLMAWVKSIRVIFNPIVQIFYPMPKSALIPIMILWLGLGHASKIVLIFLGCMLPVTLGAFNGARGCDRQLVWSARSLGASRLRILWDVVVPSALPELLNGVRTALALSFVLLVSAELIVAQSGFGYLIGFLGEGGTYDGMFAVVLVVAFLGFFADRLYQVFMDRVLAWQR